MVSPRTGKLVANKYKKNLLRVSKLESSEISQIFKNNFKMNTFYPRYGFFASEFCLGYCYHINNKNKQNGSNDNL